MFTVNPTVLLRKLSIRWYACSRRDRRWCLSEGGTACTDDGDGAREGETACSSEESTDGRMTTTLSGSRAEPVVLQPRVK